MLHIRQPRTSYQTVWMSLHPGTSAAAAAFFYIACPIKHQWILSIVEAFSHNTAHSWTLFCQKYWTQFSLSIYWTVQAIALVPSTLIIECHHLYCRTKSPYGIFSMESTSIWKCQKSELTSALNCEQNWYVYSIHISFIFWRIFYT